VNKLIRPSEFSVDRYARELGKDLSAGEQAQRSEEVGDGAAGFEREFERCAAEALGV
jgi:hypothetical protein